MFSNIHALSSFGEDRENTNKKNNIHLKPRWNKISQNAFWSLVPETCNL